MIVDSSLALSVTPPSAVTLLALIVASTLFSTLFPDPLPAPSKEKPPPSPRVIAPAIPNVNTSMVAVDSPVSSTYPSASTVAFSIDALIVLAISLTAAAAPTVMSKPPLFLLDRSSDAAPDPASAVIFVPSSVAPSVTDPAFKVVTVLPPKISASTVFVTPLPEPAPAPSNLKPPPLSPPWSSPSSPSPSSLPPEEKDPPPAKVNASIVALELAVSTTPPSAVTVELSITARTSLATSFTATEIPTAIALLLARKIATPPESALIAESSFASSVTPPLVVTELTPLMQASVTIVTLLSDSAYAPEAVNLASPPS